MARKKEFDEDDVLSRAMEIFWRKGYEATSVQDLVDEMGINRGSLYGTFSDKRQLFLAAIQHYDVTVISAVVAVLHRPGSAKKAIIDYVRGEAEKAARDSGKRHGCFLTNSAVEVGHTDPEADKRLAASMQRIESAFYDALVQARKQGEIKTKQDLHALARYLTSSVQGIRVMSKVVPDRAALLQIADIALSVLD